MKNEKEMKELFYNIARPYIRDLEEYDPGLMPLNCIRVSANENNRGVSPKAYEAMIGALSGGNRYPDSTCSGLRNKIASVYGLRPEQILVGNGLDGIFTMLGRAFLNAGDEVLCAELTFEVYAETAKIMGAVPVLVPMTDSFESDVEGFIDSITGKTKIVFFCNPNNPTGTLAGHSDIIRMLDTIPENVLFVLDEAYIDFAGDGTRSGLDLLEKYPNLIVCRTFSKIFGLAGLRVGWIASQPELLKYIYKVREPYNVSAVAAAGAEAALQDKDFISESLETVLNERDAVCRFLSENKITFIPSHGNFLLIPLGERSAAVRRALADNGIIVRLLSFRGTKMLRVSIGLPYENRAFEKSLLKAIETA
jgi:histidinol-phosphate aminotransferase